MSEHLGYEAFDKYLPQMAGLEHPAITQGDLAKLNRMWIATVGYETAHPSEKDLFSLAHSPSSYASNAWFLTQATAFTLAIHYLALPNPTTAHELPVLPNSITAHQLLSSAPWLRANGALSASNALPAERIKTVAIQHALANQVVGFFAASLRSSRAANPPAKAHQLPGIPLLSSIPLSELLDLPAPFSKNGLGEFSTAHVRTMASPSYITQVTWTGAFSYSSATSPGCNCVGGCPRDAFNRSSMICPVRDGNLTRGHIFEPVVRFHLVSGDKSDEESEIHSNQFHTESMLHELRVVVRRRTGQVTIRHWHPPMVDLWTTEGMITPFGIVSRILDSGVWLWLWRTEWSGDGA